VSGAAKPKKEFKPTIPVRRTKTLEAPLNVDNSAESSSNGRGRGGRRDDNRGRGRGRGKGKEWHQVLIFCIVMLIICLISFNHYIVFFKSEGALFGQGVCDSNPRMKSSSSAYADREGGGSSGGLEKPRLNTQVG
jgi:DNA-directed RNA polymerase III subunit RPC4